MAINKKVETEKIYISNRLNNRLKTMLEAPLTIVEAPTGYGKSTVIKEFLNKTNVDVIKPVLEICKEHGFNNPNEIDDINIAEKVLKACK